MMQPSQAGSTASKDERWLWVFFAAAWLAAFGFSAIGWENTLLGRFQFRQVQTAIAAAFFPIGTFPLNYELPLFGPPWSVPLEFPLYQASAAWFSHVTGLALDSSGRLVSWLYFQLSLPAMYLLLGSLGLRRPLRWLVLALVVTSPIYLFYSRAFLIESAALCGALWFLAAFARWISGGGLGWLLVASIGGACGAATKVTTIVVFGVGALLYVGARWRAEPQAPVRLLTRAAAAFALPVGFGLWWLVYSKNIRGLNPDTGLLETAFGYWSFGDIPQRLSFDYWRTTMETWINGVTAEGALLFAAFLFTRAAPSLRRLSVALFSVFLSGQLIFSNLYKVHDYYFYANGVFLLFAIGLLVADFFAEPKTPRAVRWAFLVLILVLQLASFARLYLPSQRTNVAPPELASILEDLTRPGDMIIVSGADWDAALPYYSHRRALMLVAGRERDPDGIKRSVDRLDPRRVGAVVIYGQIEFDEKTAHAFQHLDLEPAPLLYSHKNVVGVWFPKDRLAEARDKAPARPYATVELSQPRAGRDGIVQVGPREIMQRREFDAFSPRPIRATVPSGIASVMIGAELAFNAHVPSEIAFKIRPGMSRVRVEFGILDQAYADKHNRTDGVEYQIVHRPEAGEDRVLLSRFVDPGTRADDQGVQTGEVDLTSAQEGELLLRTLPGPSGSVSFDWAYWRRVEIR